MADDLPFVALALKSWKTQVDRAEKLFGALSSEDVLREMAPGRNRVLYLWGHLTAAHDASDFILSLMSPSSRIPTGREPTFLRTNRFARHGMP
jgi:hypothetical protein